MNPFAKYEVDRTAEAAGAVVRFDEMEFTVRSASPSNRGYKYALALAAAKRRDTLAAGGAGAFEVHDSILIEAFADCVIVGWANVDGPDGQPWPFTRDNCIALFERCPKVWEAIHEAAINDERFRPVAEDGAALGKS